MEKFKYVLENEKISGGYINIPIGLYTSPVYKELSNDAILLYGVFLNNFKFSSQSGRQDEYGRLFVVAPLSSIMQIIRCSRNKARKVLEELRKCFLIKFNDCEDKNRVRNIYLGVIKKEFSEGNNPIKESNFVSSGNDICNDNDCNNNKNSWEVGLKKELDECQKGTSKGLEKEPKYIKKSTAKGSDYEPKGGQNVNPNKNIYKNTYKNDYKNSGFQKVNGEECHYYKDFDFED